MRHAIQTLDQKLETEPTEQPACTVADAMRAVTGETFVEQRKPGAKLDLDEANVGKGLAHLVLTLVKLLHELLEKQAIRRMDAGSLTDDEVDRLGRTLAAQAKEIRAMAARYGIDERDLNLDLGPLGKVL
ncbi:MAG: gas vesicle protein K [Planctomycetota bacterium]